MAQLLQDGAEPRGIDMRLMEGSVALPTPALETTYVACGLGQKPEEFPAEVKGRIALIQRGDITFLEKTQNALQAGALAAVVYNNREGNFFGSLGDETNQPAIPAISISKADGEAMLAAIDKGQKISSARLRLEPTEVPQPDKLAEFSSRGPNNDGWIKPELTAPGVNINSATIVQAAMPGGGMPDPSGYVSASGTSMATPHVAGAAALLRQAHPDWNSLQIKAALVNTARWMNEQGTVMDQGNGALDLLRALDCRAILVTATDPICPTHAFGQVVHEGKQVAVKQALTLQHLVPDDQETYTLTAELAGNPEGLKAELSAGSVNCAAGVCVAAFDLILTADGAKLADGAYYGFVTAEASWGKLRLPFYYEAARKSDAAPPEKTSGADHGDPNRRVGKLPCC